MDIATILQQTAARTTPTASVYTRIPRRPTLMPRASTLTASISPTVIAFITPTLVDTTRTMGSVIIEESVHTTEVIIVKMECILVIIATIMFFNELSNFKK